MDETRYLHQRLDALEQMIATLTQGMIECSVGVEVTLEHLATGMTDEGKRDLQRKLTAGKRQLYDTLREWSDALVGVGDDAADPVAGMAGEHDAGDRTAESGGADHRGEQP